jgi:hypothetical protein
MPQGPAVYPEHDPRHPGGCQEREPADSDVLARNAHAVSVRPIQACPDQLRSGARGSIASRPRPSLRGKRRFGGHAE